MATDRTSAAARQLSPARPAGTPRQAPAKPSRPGLRVLSGQDLARRRERRSARILVGLSAASLAGALGLVTAFNSLVASDQIQADNVQTQVVQAIASNQSLQLAKARLEAPARIFSIAEQRLGMVQPATVTYLTPVSVPGTAAASGGGPSRSKP